MATTEKSETTVHTPSMADSHPAIMADKLDASNWHPGYRARFPVIGFLGILGVLICMLINIAVLIGSDNVSSSKWPVIIAPHTIVNVIQSIGALCLALAVAEGVTIAWWRKAVKGATVAELHRSWTFSMSFYQIVRYFWAFDVIALAFLAAKLTILDSFLFQSAATTYTTQDPAKNVTLIGVAAQDFPQTGYVVAEGFAAQTSCACFMIGDTYTPTVNTWETSNGFFQNVNYLFQNCNGVCYTYIDAIGFEIDCQQSSNHTNYASGAIAAYDEADGKGNDSEWSNLPIFNSSFAMSYADDASNYSLITLDLLYFDSDNPYDPSSESCPGTITNVQCSLRPALVRYPMTIVNYTNVHITNGVSIGGQPHDGSNTNAPPVPAYSYSSKQAGGFEVLSYLVTSDRNQVNTTTQLGGIANALSQFLSSSAAITYTGGSVWSLTQQGTLSQTMMYGPPNMGSCDCSFRDALPTLVNGINQLAFLTATNQTVLPSGSPSVGGIATVVGVVDNTTATVVAMADSLQISDAIYYETQYIYLALGAASTVLSLLLILPSFWHYNELGRPVTLGPMEIASAFRAPMLEAAPGEEEHVRDLDELIVKVGHRKVVYGVVDEPSHIESSSVAAEKADRPVPALIADATATSNVGRGRSVRLGMGEPMRVRPVSGIYSRAGSSPLSSPMTSPKATSRPFLQQASGDMADIHETSL